MCYQGVVHNFSLKDILKSIVIKIADSFVLQWQLDA